MFQERAPVFDRMMQRSVPGFAPKKTPRGVRHAKRYLPAEQLCQRRLLCQTAKGADRTAALRFLSKAREFLFESLTQPETANYSNEIRGMAIARR
jgi:hypothetical protein